MRKKVTLDDYEEIHGPMNSVSKEDALIWAGAPPVKHLSKLDPDTQRIVRAKKSKAQRSSKKQDRKASKEIMKHIGD